MSYIRNCAKKDLSELVNLFDSYRVFYNMESDIDGAKTFLSERIATNESVIFVSEGESSILTGFVQLYPIFSSTRMKRLWLLNDLFVAPIYRGKGISKLLIKQAQQFCIETNSCGLLLETAKSNIIGNNLYPSVGFELDGNHNYYSWDC